ncbi:MAG: leucine-rich repeat protein [Bacteroidaceae bacterium]|nr:leucine-rich repeat protein [Bacteroidaceae bacterium]
MISDGEKSIGFASFYGCSNLRNISIPESVLKIRHLAFSGCSILTEVRIPKGCDVQRFAFELFSNTKIIRY